jgi:5-methylcytosine-specific restriction endonuclease McrA
MTYARKLKDPRWQKKRLQVFEAADWACQLCGDKKSMLHAHHWSYERNRNPWEYPAGMIACLCEKCHAIAHGRQKRARKPAVTSEGPGRYHTIAKK